MATITRMLGKTDRTVQLQLRVTSLVAG